MLNFTQGDLEAIAAQVLEMHPDPVPRFRLFRDVLRLDSADPRYRAAQVDLQKSRWIVLLKDSQMDDGSWGRFHTRDSRLKQPFPTTEIAITTALAGQSRVDEVGQRKVKSLRWRKKAKGGKKWSSKSLKSRQNRQPFCAFGVPKVGDIVQSLVPALNLGHRHQRSVLRRR